MTYEHPEDFSPAPPDDPGMMYMPSRLNLWRLIYYLPDAMLVTDGQGYVLLVNPASENLLGFHLDRNSRPHVRDLVESGIYNRSTVVEAIAQRTTVTGLIENHAGRQIMTSSRPVFNEEGEIEFVITCSRSISVVEEFMVEVLKDEQAKLDRYRSVVSYLGKVPFSSQPMVYKSSLMNTVISMATNIAKLDSTVLLVGESGTGKELLANFIHQKSQRSREAFIPVNCAAIPQELLESELFGYARGAFSGAGPRGKPGLFEISDGGTLFLDEIGELPLNLQPKLLRVLESGEVQRLGSTERKRINVRIIAATNRALWEMVQNNQFRADLYFRIHVIPIHLPALRDRPEDLLSLAEHFLDECNRKYGHQKRFLDCGKKALLNYSWPGNARELRNVVERLSLVIQDQLISGVICRSALQPDKSAASDPFEIMPLRQFRARSEHRYIMKVLGHFHGNVAKAAEALGMHRVALHRKLRDLTW